MCQSVCEILLCIVHFGTDRTRLSNRGPEARQAASLIFKIGGSLLWHIGQCVSGSREFERLVGHGLTVFRPALNGEFVLLIDTAGAGQFAACRFQVCLEVHWRLELADGLFGPATTECSEIAIELRLLFFELLLDTRKVDDRLVVVSSLHPQLAGVAAAFDKRIYYTNRLGFLFALFLAKNALVQLALQVALLLVQTFHLVLSVFGNRVVCGKIGNLALNFNLAFPPFTQTDERFLSLDIRSGVFQFRGL